MKQAYPEIELNLPPQKFTPQIVFGKLVNLVLYCVISAIAIFTALGYQPNIAAQTIDQTGLIELYPSYAYAADVYINGEKQDGGIPLRKGWIRPGQFEVRVERSGYQIWSHQVHVQENQRAIFEDILLIFTNPPVLDLPSLKDDAFLVANSDTADIEVRDNELWIKEKFITRFSSDIISARWFSDRKHIVLQLDQQLFLADLDGTNLQLLATVTTPQVIDYTFQDNGRVLVYKENALPKALALFERLSIIERWGSGQ